MSKKGQTFRLQVRPVIPEALSRLEELAGDLWFSTNSYARALFYQIDPVLWTLSGHNPRLFLRRASQHRLNDVAADRAFLALYNGVMSEYDSYIKEGQQWFPKHYEDAERHHFAYFSAEFGLHESLPIYSGGLGILAGDHCKSASDLGLPFTGVGLLYRHGYFSQVIDAQGRQIATYLDCRFEDLAIEAGDDGKGGHLLVSVQLPGRKVDLKVWLAKMGHIHLVLLDANVDSNSADDRKITHQLYGGDIENRIKQEMCLSIGGVRALAALGIRPSAWHINEGHAAFIILERMREYVQQGLNFDEALEMTKATTVFTTHTPVPAGHDIFPLSLFDSYMGKYAKALGVTPDTLRLLGYGSFGHGAEGFNQTALALRGSAYHNGVSKLHGEVSSRICASMWPDVPAEENPITSVTNGVHVSTWLAPEWIGAFDRHLGGQWRGRLMRPEFWEAISDIPDYLFWSIHQSNKNRMLQHVRRLLLQQAKRNGESVQMVQEMTASFDVRTLVVGFARRFATYKRATLLFHDEAKLLQMLEDVGHPVVFLFAGKAHPADQPGQELIRRVHGIARKPEFIGKVLMLEGYDMTLSRYLTSGVDVWLNNPIRPLEASGTSGMKAAMNGVPNLSVLDGWWPEGYQSDNGWVIGGERELADESRRDTDDAASLYHTLRFEVIPTYYRRNESGFSDAWVRIAKRAMITSIPYFNSDRMAAEYCERFYVPLSRKGVEMAADGFARAKALAAWKAKVRRMWSKTSLELINGHAMDEHWNYGDDIRIRVHANLDGLSWEDVRVEVVFFRPSRGGESKRYGVTELKHEGDNIFAAKIDPGDTGEFSYEVRMYPKHEDLSHPHAMGLMTWL